MRLPSSSKTPQFMLHDFAGTGSGKLASSCHFSMSMYFLCLMIRLSLTKKIGIRFLIARLSGSHELAEYLNQKRGSSI